MSFTDHPLLEKQALDIPTLVMSIGSQSIALPAMSVAEVVSGTKVKPIKSSPQWLCGEIIWRERAVPLVDLDFLSIEHYAERPSDEPIAVLNSAGGSEHFQFLAIRIAQIPMLKRLMASDVKAYDNQSLPCMKLAVEIEGEQYWIPDLVELENTWLKYVEQLNAKR